MIARFTLATLLVVAAAGSAFALIPPFEATAMSNETVIEKNQAFPLVGPLTVEDCTSETCEDIQS